MSDAPPNPPHLIRRLVVQRIRGMLAGLERARRQPNRREAYYLCESIEHLQAGLLPESEEALRNAAQVRPLPTHVAGLLEVNRLPTVQALREELNRLAQE